MNCTEEIVKLNNCICLHESNLPKFRGGSPIQNQIIKGIKKTANKRDRYEYPKEFL